MYLFSIVQGVSVYLSISYSTRCIYLSSVFSIVRVYLYIYTSLVVYTVYLCIYPSYISYIVQSVSIYLSILYSTRCVSIYLSIHLVKYRVYLSIYLYQKYISSIASLGCIHQWSIGTERIYLSFHLKYITGLPTKDKISGLIYQPPGVQKA